MTLRTPRRRISPRTKRRYRAIKDFLRRALGSSSQQEIKINSSIAVNVTDLKHKIVGLEHQLNEVNRHLICVETSSRRDSGISVPEIKDDIDEEQTEVCERNTKGSNTKVIYKPSQNQYRKSEESDSISKLSYDHHENRNVINKKIVPEKYKMNEPKIKSNKNKSNLISENLIDKRHPNSRQHKMKSVYENIASSYSTSSYHSLFDPRYDHRVLHNDYPNRRYDRKHRKSHEYEATAVHEDVKDKKYKEEVKRNRSDIYALKHEERHTRKRKDKHAYDELSQDFIADIIKRQYKPIKLFGRRESDISQFSAPVCRDQEFAIREDIIEGSDLCSCCYDSRRCRYNCQSDLSDMRSICDTRLYSSKRYTRHKTNKRHFNNFNDSTLYDLVPVKEKSSPKSRRKFVEDNVMSYACYKEVPPSPRTLRPRLNLQSQYNLKLEEAFVCNRKHRKRSPLRLNKQNDYTDSLSNDDSSEIEKQKVPKTLKKHSKVNIQQNVATTSSLHSPTFNNDLINVNPNDTLKSQDTESSTDKTDKALCEIKDILKSFLQEIKKESISQCGKSDISNKTDENHISLNEYHDQANKINTGVLKHSSHSGINNYNLAACSHVPPPYITPYHNPCCYPVLPICPINCMQNGYVMPTPSFTCATCANKEDVQPKQTNTVNDTFTTNNNETEQLIKEIYNFVTQTPKSNYKKEYCDRSVKGPKIDLIKKHHTTRSVGDSSRHSKHDVKVGTAKLKCYSKSCEAIGSPLTEEDYSRTNPSYSDTILDKLSLEATATESISESELSSDTILEKKGKGNKFANVLRTFGLLKKKKNDVIEELSESESTIEVNIKKSPPFRQEITNYMMRGQEYFQQPPIPPCNERCRRGHGDQHGYEQQQYFGPGCSGYPDPMLSQPPFNTALNHHKGHTAHNPPFRTHDHPTAPPFSANYHSFNHMQPQVPLCLKEIEVKSIATQSERKMSFFRKLTKKIQEPMPVHMSDGYPQKNCSTQTNQSKPGFWKSLQMKPTSPEFNNTDPMKFSYKTQKKLAEGDFKLKNAMLKKMFYKRNPFSPRNLIVRTLLGKDKSSFGDPPMIYRPRMFF